MADPEMIKFDEKGRYIPYLDKMGDPIIDPGVLKVPQPIKIDFKEFGTSKLGQLDPRNLIPSKKNYPLLYSTI